MKGVDDRPQVEPANGAGSMHVPEPLVECRGRCLPDRRAHSDRHGELWVLYNRGVVCRPVGDLRVREAELSGPSAGISDMPLKVRCSMVATMAAALGGCHSGPAGGTPTPTPTPTPTSTPSPTPTPTPYNVLLIVVDDLGLRVGCYGAPVVTPHIDALAARGVRMSRAYCGYPLCAPSRSSFLTGLRADRVSSTQVPFRTVYPSVVSLPQNFRAQGYYTAGIGKVFHDDVGWDNSGEWEHFEQDFANTPLGSAGQGEDLTRGHLTCCRWQSAEGTDDDQADGLIAQAAIRVLENRPSRPFLLGVGFHKPHDPFAAPTRYFDSYPLSGVLTTQPPGNDRADIPVAALPDAFPFTADEARQLTQAYYASTSFVDVQVGRVLSALDRLELRDKTIVVLVGDNGRHEGEHQHWDKNTLFAPSVNVPWVFAGPGVIAGRVYAEPVELLGLYATLAEMCGLAIPSTVEGASLASVLRGSSDAGPRAAFNMATPNGVVGHQIATSLWHYNEWGTNGRDGMELYDEQHEPGEITNLAHETAYATVVSDLQQRLRAHWQ